MDSSKFTCAIWPWGTDTREQMEQAAKDITSVGFETFESVKAAIYAYDLDINAYKEVLKKYSIKPVSFYFHLPGWEEEEKFFSTLDKELDFVSKLDVGVLSLQATIGRPEEMGKAELEREFNVVMRFAKTASKFGLTACLHPHHNTWVMKEEEIRNILDNTTAKELSFVPDTAHLIVGGCDHVGIIRDYADRVKFTHLKDFTAGADISSAGIAAAGMEVYTNFAELGTGSVDFKSVFEILKNAGYNGYYCAELDSAPISNLESAKNNFNYLKENL